MSSEPQGDTPRPTSVLITLGSNLEPEANLPRALRLLAERVRVARVSKVYETAPVNAAGEIDPEQPPFLNAAVQIETEIEPVPLKYEVLRAIEAEMGRVRSEDKFAPRVIDLDIALYGDLLLQLDTGDMRLVLPDPDILERPHVALPLADLAPDLMHPTAGQTLSAIAGTFAGYTTIRPRPDIQLA